MSRTKQRQRRQARERAAEIAAEVAAGRLALPQRDALVAPTTTLTVTRVDELPPSLDPWRVYVVGEDGQSWSAAMVCPCGCRETLHMNLLPGPYARWTIVEHEDRTVSLKPSVNRTVGCRSHFFVRRGLIEWCARVPTS